MSFDNFNITISNVSFVVYRKSDENWNRINLVNHERFLLIFAAAGKANYEVDSDKFTVIEGDIMFFNKGQYHTGFSDREQPWTYYTVAFDARLSEGITLDHLNIPLLTHSSKPEFFRSLYETLNYEWTAKKTGYHLLCCGIVSELLCTLIRENGNERKKSNAIEMVKMYMIQNYIKDMTVNELASIAGVSASHFHRIFKENTGLSVKRYLNTIRINKARDLLQSGEHNITEVAYNVGFEDIYYFSRLFKKITGVPPSSLTSKRKKLY